MPAAFATDLPRPMSRSRALYDRGPAASPILKWAGGKKRMMAQLITHFPTEFGRYYEPFLGGAAVFMTLRPPTAVLSDVNEDLIQLYRVVQQDVEALITALSRYQYDRDTYYLTRAIDPATLSPVGRAARMLYLNRTCFNGLYRVNRRGQFNVPMGRYKNPTICDGPKLRRASEALRGASLQCVDFDAAVAGARAGDLVYFDPPYIPITKTSNFTSYTRSAFGPEAQARLAQTFDDLTARGVRCVLSNSSAPEVRELYGRHQLHEVTALRAIARDPKARGTVAELVVTNF